MEIILEHTPNDNEIVISATPPIIHPEPILIQSSSENHYEKDEDIEEIEPKSKETQLIPELIPQY